MQLDLPLEGKHLFDCDIITLPPGRNTRRTCWVKRCACQLCIQDNISKHQVNCNAFTSFSTSIGLIKQSILTTHVTTSKLLSSYGSFGFTFLQCYESLHDIKQMIGQYAYHKESAVLHIGLQFHLQIPSLIVSELIIGHQL